MNMKQPRKLPPADELRLLLRANKSKGTLRWRPRTEQYYKSKGVDFALMRARSFNERHSCKIATYGKPNGYHTVYLDRQAFGAHRVIYKIYHGVDPFHIDHINGDPSDNRLKNIRSVTPGENAKNTRRRNAEKIYGVSKRGKGWIAYIGVDGKAKYLGSFKLKRDAIAARKEAEVEFGYHSNHGRVKQRKS